jgi:hypothetical protein
MRQFKHSIVVSAFAAAALVSTAPAAVGSTVVDQPRASVAEAWSPEGRAPYHADVPEAWSPEARTGGDTDA